MLRNGGLVMADAAAGLIDALPIGSRERSTKRGARLALVAIGLTECPKWPSARARFPAIIVAGALPAEGHYTWQRLGAVVVGARAKKVGRAVVTGG